MFSRSRSLLAILLLTALLSGLIGCAAPPPPAATQVPSPSSQSQPTPQPKSTAPTGALTKVTFRLDWQAGAQHAPFYLAKAKGYYAQEGIDLDIISGSGSSDSVKFLGTGTVDIALVDALVLVQAKAQQVPLQSVAVYYQQNPIVVISPQSKPVKTPQELIGKKLGSKKGSATYQGLMVFLAANKIQPEQLQMVDIGFGVQPLLVGQVDALMGFTMNEPIEAATGGMPTHEMRITDYGVHAYGLTVAASNKFIQEKGTLLRGFLRATKKGMEDSAKDNEGAVNALAKAVTDINTARELKVMAKTIPVWQNDDTKANGYGWQSNTGWQQTVDTTTNLKLVEQAPDVKTLYTNDFLK